MADNKLVTIPSADCDFIDIPSKSAPPLVQLSIFSPPEYHNPASMLQRTIEYTQNPREYLKNKLGPDLFAERQHLLCIPELVDKDIYGSGHHKEHFEKHVAALLGKDHGLFFITGVQAQLAGLKIYCTRAHNNRVAWHVTSHLESSEEQAYEHLYGLERILLGNDPEANPVEGIMEVLALPDASRPAAVVLEIPNRTLGCQTYTFAELEKISAECRKVNVKLHCDGARIWEIEPYYQETAGKTFSDVGALFDSVYVSFYKGLGGASGAMLMSNDTTFINDAKVWQRRAGGNLFTSVYQVIDDERGFNENIGSFGQKWKKMDEIVREVTKATAAFTTETGNPIIGFVPARPTCGQIHTSFEGFTSDELMAARDAVEKKTNIQVFTRLKQKRTVDETLRMQRAAQSGSAEPPNVSPLAGDKMHRMEWMIINVVLAIDTEVFVKGYVALCQELLAK